MNLINLENKEINLKQLVSQLELNEKGFSKTSPFAIKKESEKAEMYIPVRLYGEDNNKSLGNEGYDISTYTLIDPLFYKTAQIIGTQNDLLSIDNMSSQQEDLFQSEFKVSVYDVFEVLSEDKITNLLKTHEDLFLTQYNLLNQAYKKITGETIENHNSKDLESIEFYDLSSELRKHVDTGKTIPFIPGKGIDYNNWKGRSFTMLHDFVKLSDSVFKSEFKNFEDGDTPARILFDTKIAVLNGMYKTK